MATRALENQARITWFLEQVGEVFSSWDGIKGPVLSGDLVRDTKRLEVFVLEMAVMIYSPTRIDQRVGFLEMTGYALGLYSEEDENWFEVGLEALCVKDGWQEDVELLAMVMDKVYKGEERLGFSMTLEQVRLLDEVGVALYRDANGALHVSEAVALQGAVG